MTFPKNVTVRKSSVAMGSPTVTLNFKTISSQSKPNHAMHRSLPLPP